MLVNLERMTSMMDEYRLDALVATTPENVAYSSDYMVPGHKLLGSSVYVILPREVKSEAAMILPVGEISDIVCSNWSWIDDLRCYGTFYIERPAGRSTYQQEERIAAFIQSVKPADAVDALVEALKDKGLSKSRIGLDEVGVTANVLEKIRQKLPNAEIIDAYDIFREIRMVKTEEEKRRLRRSVNITEKAISSVLEIAREGVTVEQLVNRLKSTMIEEGATPAYPSIGISTENFLQNMPPTKKKLKRGDLIRFDSGCIYKYYYSDIARMAILGKPNEKQERYYSAVVQGEEEALKLVRPGVRASEIFDVTVQAVRKSGIPHYKRHHVGHGIGIELYDPPLIAPSSATALEKDMVLNLETPYYELGFGGVQIEDCIAVTQKGYEMFNKSGRELYEV